MIAYVAGTFLVVGCLGIIGGTAVSLVLAKGMSTMLYGIHANDPVTFVLAAVVLLLASLFGAFLPAYRASRSNPATALRMD